MPGLPVVPRGHIQQVRLIPREPVTLLVHVGRPWVAAAARDCRELFAAARGVHISVRAHRHVFVSLMAGGFSGSGAVWSAAEGF